MRILRLFVAVLAISLPGASSATGQQQVTLTVDATMDLYRAGGNNDGSDGIAPAVYTFRAGGRKTVTFSSISGAWTCSPSVPQYGPDGTSTGCFQPGGQNIFDPGGPFSSYHLTDLEGAVAGVFLQDSLPTAQPPGLRFYQSNAALGGIPTDFHVLSPEIGQIFFIGDGLTGSASGSIQVFVVPPAATHLYLGYVDSCNGGAAPGCYSDNSGAMTANLVLRDYEPDWVEPPVTSAPSPRCCSAIAYDAARQYTLLFGGGPSGQPNPDPHNDTWVWRKGWHQLAPPASPPRRNSSAAAYDASTATVVLFGGTGVGGNTLNDTWTWDGVTWTRQFPPVSPPPRLFDSQGMAYDAATQTVVLFGGSSNNVALGDTWEWDGRAKTWTQRFPPASPTPRQASLAYDPLTATVVTFGGENDGFLNDTWAWDGNTWTQYFPPVSPSARGDAGLAFDATLGMIVLFGGRTYYPGVGLNDTWAWNGSTWTELHPPSQPGGRYAAAMDFDPLSGGLLLFGGWLECCTPDDDTWLFVPVPAP